MSNKGAIFHFRRIFRFLFLITTVNFFLVLPVLQARAEDAAMTTEPRSIYQLRIYEIFEHNKSAFHDRFRDHAARIMRAHGFDIVDMWESTSGQRTEFVYMVRWPDEATMRNRWAAFMADKEWSDVKMKTAAQHGDMVGAIEERILRKVPYSPTPGESIR